MTVMGINWPYELADLQCPITQCVPGDPVESSEGYVYERVALLQWVCRWVPLSASERVMYLLDKKAPWNHWLPQSPLTRQPFRVSGPPSDAWWKRRQWVLEHAAVQGPGPAVDVYRPSWEEQWNAVTGLTGMTAYSRPLPESDEAAVRQLLTWQPMDTYRDPDAMQAVIGLSYYSAHRRWFWGNRAWVRDLLGRADLDWSVADSSGWTLLHTAVYRAPGRVLVRLLADLARRGVLTDHACTRVTDAGRNVFHYASRWQPPQVLRALWKWVPTASARAALHARDTSGHTPWEYTISGSRTGRAQLRIWTWWAWWDHLAQHPDWLQPVDGCAPITQGPVPRRRHRQLPVTARHALTPSMWTLLMRNGNADIWGALWENHQPAEDALVWWWQVPTGQCYPRALQLLLMAGDHLNEWLATFWFPTMVDCMTQCTTCDHLFGLAGVDVTQPPHWLLRVSTHMWGGMTLLAAAVQTHRWGVLAELQRQCPGESWAPYVRVTAVPVLR